MMQAVDNHLIDLFVLQYRSGDNMKDCEGKCNCQEKTDGEIES